MNPRMKKATEGRADKREVESVVGAERRAEKGSKKRRRTKRGRVLPASMLVVGVLVLAAGVAGFAVTRSLARTDSLREAELDRKILAEASQLSDSAVDRLSLASAWAQAAQLIEPNAQSGSAPRPPVARWHIGSIVIREQSPAGTGLRARLNGSPSAVP